MLDFDPLEGYRDPQTYDLEEAGHDDDRPFVEQWARTLGGPILDLACGTGTIALSLAGQGYHVTGVDIVPEMIAWATQKAARQGASVEWVVGDARALDLQRRYPLIYMVGNAFQHFLTRTDQEALLARVRAHLRPEGCFLFGTRNPSPRNLFEARVTEPQEYVTSDGGRLTVTEQQSYDPIAQVQRYAFHRHWRHPSGREEERITHTALRYVFPQEMEALLHYNGFQARACYGGWREEPLTAASREMVYVCQRRA